MKKTVMNPYLPLYEYIPDAEPRIFENRLFVYGSHDLAGGELGYCTGDYMVWSAPIEDLSNWTCHGVSFPRSSCPVSLKPEDGMAAPDVVRGTDGRYYMYFQGGAWGCHIAVSDMPEGPFHYMAEVSNPDGTPYTVRNLFDPAVLVDDDGRIFLYAGSFSRGVETAGHGCFGI